MNIAIAPPIDALADLSDVNAASIASGKPLLAMNGSGYVIGAAGATYEGSDNTLVVKLNAGQTLPALVVKDASGVLVAGITASGLQLYNTSGTATTLIGRASTMSGVTFNGNVVANNELRINGPFVAKGSASFDQQLTSWDTALVLSPMTGGVAAGQTVACQIGSTRTSVTQLRVKAPTGATADILQVQNGASANQFSVRSDGKAIAHVGLGVGNSAAAATLGSVTGKVEIFDASGTSLGFVPVYDSIT